MKRFVSGLTLGLILGGAITALAVNFTMVLTQSQVDDVTWKWNQDDASHTTWATAQLYAAAKVGQLISIWHDEKRLNRRALIGGPSGYFCVNTWSGLSTGAKNAVCSQLGEASGCTACDIDGN